MINALNPYLPVPNQRDGETIEPMGQTVSLFHSPVSGPIISSPIWFSETPQRLDGEIENNEVIPSETNAPFDTVLAGIPFVESIDHLENLE